MQKLNIDDIAKLAFVSKSVVSRVLNNRPNVSTEARERVWKVIKENNYTPNAAARSLVTDRTYEISILAPRRENNVLANGFWSLIFLGISEQALKRGYFVSLSMISGDMEETINDRIVYGRNFDGYILITREVTDVVVPALRSREVPAVLIGHDPENPDFSSVDVNNIKGAYDATKHLIDLGHKNIAAIMGNLHMQESIDRLTGYEKAHKDAGLAINPTLTKEGDYSRESGYALMEELLAQEIPPTAIFCASDSMATGAILKVHRAGLHVPGDVSVVGFDDLPNATYTIPPLTSVHQPIYQKGELAASILIDQIDGKNKEIVHRELEAGLVVRETTGPPK